jgi:hypothetical protein
MFTGSRFLRREDAGVYQSIFYLGRCRSDARGLRSLLTMSA